MQIQFIYSFVQYLALMQDSAFFHCRNKQLSLLRMLAIQDLKKTIITHIMTHYLRVSHSAQQKAVGKEKMLGIVLDVTLL